MAIENFLDQQWQELLIKLHADMLSENAIYEEMADENELEGEKLDEFFRYHRTED